MSKTALWVLIGAVLIIGGYILIKPHSTQVTQNADTQDQAAAQEETPVKPTDGKKIPFSELVKKEDGSYKCTVNQHIGGMDTQGITYINNGMIRGEFSTKVQSINVDTTFIVRDGYSYSWSSMLPAMGYKVKVAGGASEDAGAAASASYSFNADQIGDYDCQPWSVEDSKFAIPASVTFKDLSSMSAGATN